jgi:hypothetical protein
MTLANVFQPISNRFKSSGDDHLPKTSFQLGTIDEKSAHHVHKSQLNVSERGDFVPLSPTSKDHHNCCSKTDGLSATESRSNQTLTSFNAEFTHAQPSAATQTLLLNESSTQQVSIFSPTLKRETKHLNADYKGKGDIKQESRERGRNSSCFRHAGNDEFTSEMYNDLSAALQSLALRNNDVIITDKCAKMLPDKMTASFASRREIDNVFHVSLEAHEKKSASRGDALVVTDGRPYDANSRVVQWVNEATTTTNGIANYVKGFASIDDNLSIASRDSTNNVHEICLARASDALVRDVDNKCDVDDENQSLRSVRHHYDVIEELEKSISFMNDLHSALQDI